MGVWTDRIKNHPLWQQLSLLGPAIDQAFVREGIETSTLEGLHRLKSVLTFIGRRLAGMDHNLLIPGPMDNMNSVIQSATSEVQSFVANGSAGHITNANSHADNALAYLASLHVPVVTEDFVALRESADAYRSAIEQNMRSLESVGSHVKNELEDLRNRLTDFAREVSGEKDRLSSLTSEHQSQFSSSQESRNREYAEAQSSRQEKFSQMLLDYNKALGEQNTEFGRQRESLLQQREKDLGMLTEEYKNYAKGLLDEIESHKSQVEKLVGVIGNLGVTSGYQKTARGAKWNALIWQIVALASLSCMGWLAFSEVLPLLTTTFTWEGLATRVVIFAPLGLIAAYAISQADKYQQVERRSGRLALELEAIGPFIASLPMEKQQEFRLKIGDRSFGTTADFIDRRSAKSPASLIDVLLKSKELKEYIMEIAKSVKH